MRLLNECVAYLHRPCDPSLLAYLRICFGLLMMIDIPQERGMAYADLTYGIDAQSLCTFPLIHGMKPLERDFMILLYAVLFSNAFCIAIGFFYRLNAISFTCIYWYIFILDTSAWNNHSYLYGLLAFLLTLTDAHHFWSVDGLIHKQIRNRDVPYWNYFLVRYQVFLVYFIAGLKKTEVDWLSGYSMHRLSQQWVFDPMRLILTDDGIDFWVVHIGGFVFDTSVGFLLAFDNTRFLGLFLCGTFHGLNSRIFSIGMFPYVMFAVSFMFCDPKSFRRLLAHLPLLNHCIDVRESSRNQSCFYASSDQASKKNAMRWTWKHYLTAVFAALYVSEQAFLPYSHFLTKGYNGWTQGLYGYSWDMMVHSFHNQHVKIAYENKETGEIGYLKPMAFLPGKRSRWTTQPSMAVQYAKCIKRQLNAKFDVKDAAVYIDVWKSLNKRFQQRIFDPRVDLSQYPWSPFANPSFVLPLLSELSEWRERLKNIKLTLRNITMDYDVVFVADFPGMHLENYVHEDLGNTTIEVLKGKVIVETASQQNISLKENDTLQVEAGAFHKVYTVSPTPSCYSYVYINTTAQNLRRQLKDFEKQLAENDDAKGAQVTGGAKEFEAGIADLYWREQAYKTMKENSTWLERWNRFATHKFGLFRRSAILAAFSVRNLLFGRPTSDDQILAESAYLDSWIVPRNNVGFSPKQTSRNHFTKGSKTEL